ncbi:hypothetical protein FHS72_002128 [Loktanella ponticola]|uniref:DUF2971 domain-containing protein n=1 Tax=Yoonia ponticola TaxID=1524255 RepID=A0A7W9BL20_9RHOB|nr:DUF2971 domain-containing protein [Yoonia ponticola]MBB5722502.1 hypothetical protein [Yoonia ponticola]
MVLDSSIGSETLDHSDVIYHYTTLEGLIGIVQSRSIRLSHIRALNDPREDVAGRRLVDGLLDGLGYLPGSKEAKALALMKQAYASIASDIVFFGASYSSQRDSLAQWLEYGGRGTGVCIGFRRNALTSHDGDHELVQIAYTQTEFLTAVQKIYSDFHSKLMKYDESELSTKYTENVDSISDRQEEMFADCFGFTRDILKQAGSFKDSSWQHENETRQIAFTYSFGKGENSTLKIPESLEKACSGKVQYRASQNTIIPYISAEFQPDVYDGDDEDVIALGEIYRAIESVTIGHKCNANIEIVSAMLNASKFRSFIVKKSACEFV